MPARFSCGDKDVNVTSFVAKTISVPAETDSFSIHLVIFCGLFFIILRKIHSSSQSFWISSNLVYCMHDYGKIESKQIPTSGLCTNQPFQWPIRSRFFDSVRDMSKRLVLIPDHCETKKSCSCHWVFQNAIEWLAVARFDSINILCSHVIFSGCHAGFD